MLISKEEAAKLDQKWYYTGKPCKNNHIDKRYINTNICYECKRLRNKNCNNRNKDTLAKISKRSYIKNKEKSIERSQRWSENNREKSNNIKKKYKIKHRDKYLKYCSEYQKEKRKNPYIRLSKNISKSIWESLKGNKNCKSWKTYVDFSLEELITHLEIKFTLGMTWDNYGSFWHLDHIKPLSWFKLDIEFKDAWALNNLQPLKAIDNLSKGNRYVG